MNKEKKSRKLNFLILVILTPIVLFFAMRGNFHQIVEYISQMNIWWLLVAFIMMFVYWLLRSIGLNIFTRKIDKKATFKSSYQLALRTQFVNAVTPFATGGQPYQIYYLAKNGMNASSATSVIIQNAIVFQIALVFIQMLSVLANYFFGIFQRIPSLAHLVTIGFLVNFAVIVILFTVSFSSSANKKIVHFGISLLSKLRIVKDKAKKEAEWSEHISKFHDSAKLLLSKKSDFIAAVFFNFVSLLVLYSIPLIILFATGDFSSFNIFQAIVTSAYVSLIGAFIPTPGGTGGLEFGFIMFYGNFVGGARLTAIMLVWRFITYYFGIIVGSVAMYMRKVKV